MRRSEIEQRQSYMIDVSKGTAARLAELLRHDPDGDITTQLECVKGAAREYKHCTDALATIPPMTRDDVEIEFTPIDWCFPPMY